MKKARKNSKQAYRELMKVLNFAKSPSLHPKPVIQPKPKEPQRFKEGQEYRIRALKLGKADKGDHWEAECLFRYECKTGIHYVFREVRGGWIRTYTDAQLVGKVIEEVRL
mgnify:CR=1 FL=1